MLFKRTTNYYGIFLPFKRMKSILLLIIAVFSIFAAEYDYCISHMDRTDAEYNRFSTICGRIPEAGSKGCMGNYSVWFGLAKNSRHFSR